MAAKHRSKHQRNTELAETEPHPNWHPESPGTGVFYALAAVPAVALAAFVLFFGLFGATVTAGLDRACAEASFVAGEQMRDRGNLEQAVILYRQALEGRFENTERRILCQRSLGELLLRLDRPDEAVAAFMEIPDEGFTHAGTYTAFVNALLRAGEADAAIEWGAAWVTAAEADANPEQLNWAHFARAQALERMGDLEGALLDYQASARHAPGSAADLMVAQTLARLGRPDEATAHLDALLPTLPEGRTRRDAEQIRAGLSGQ